MSRRLIASSRLFDVFARTRYIDASAERALRAEGLSQTDLSAFSPEMYAIVGHKKLTGFEMYRALVARIPLLLPVLPLFLFSPITRQNRPTTGMSARIFSSPSSHPLAKTSRRRKPWLNGVMIVGSLFLSANVYCGARNIDSWPFAVYPQFAEILEGAVQRSLEIVVQTPTGQTRLVKPRLRWTAVRRIVRIKDPAERMKRLRAVQHLLLQDGLALQPGDSLQFYEVTRSTIPEERNSNFLQRELLLEFHYEP
jgi:hypothetical protein